VLAAALEGVKPPIIPLGFQLRAELARLVADNKVKEFSALSGERNQKLVTSEFGAVCLPASLRVSRPNAVLSAIDIPVLARACDAFRWLRGFASARLTKSTLECAVISGDHALIREVWDAVSMEHRDPLSLPDSPRHGITFALRNGFSKKSTSPGNSLRP
jgi:hypothetical protein